MNLLQIGDVTFSHHHRTKDSEYGVAFKKKLKVKKYLIINTVFIQDQGRRYRFVFFTQTFICKKMALKAFNIGNFRLNYDVSSYQTIAKTLSINTQQPGKL